MRRKLSFVLAALLLLTLLGGCSSSSSTKKNGVTGQLPEVTDAMYAADYWIAKMKSPDTVLLSSSEIGTVNAQIANDEDSGVADLVSYPSSLTSVQLKRYLNAVSIPTSDLFDADGVQYEESFFDDLILSINVENVEETNKVSYAIALTNTALRTFPVLAAAYEDAKKPEIDVFQLGQVFVGDPVIILHTNVDNTWFFIQTRTQRGWVRATDMIFMEKGSWVSYIETTNFILVTAPSITLENNPYSSTMSNLTLYMGTRLPLYTDDTVPSPVDNRGTAGCYVAKYPTVDRFGYLEYQPLLIPMTEDVSVGYLPYTAANVVTQALKLTGRRIASNRIGYGRDSATFVQDLYAVFGIFMPATTDAQQEILAGDTDMVKMTSAEREKTLGSLTAGTLLYSDDRAFVLLGVDNKKPYVVSAIDEYYYDNLRNLANATVITSLDIVKKDGTLFLDTLEVAKVFGVVKEKDTATTTATTTAGKATTTVSGTTSASGTTKAGDQGTTSSSTKAASTTSSTSKKS
ncbi:MAG: SH3 domain-containing protein [Clostridiaceae bacterium]|nr:SH3 domain-containing protein [Clostridiaceae bacterium]